MDRFIEQAAGLREPRLAVSTPGLPTLPELKSIARDRRAAGKQVIDQSAGDIDDVGQPLSDAFLDWIEEARTELLEQGFAEFRRTTGDPYGFPGHYQQQYSLVTAALARSWGITNTSVRAIQTVSGRCVIDFTLRGLLARAKERGQIERPALIMDPLAWPGYKPLAADLGVALIHAPAVPGNGLRNSTESLQAALAFARERGFTPIAVIPILPSNPSGEGMAGDELQRFIECAAEAGVPVVIDAFYSPLAPEGHLRAISLDLLEQRLAPEALGHVGLIVGETKVTSSQNKTGTLLWMAPPKHDSIANAVVEPALRRMRTTNSYPRPEEALVSYALHTFAGGLQAAMGPRYKALDATRSAMRAACDEHDLPLSIGGSFYGTVALVDAQGESLMREADGSPASDPRKISELLIDRFGLVGAPGGMFSSAPEANMLVRLTAAVTLQDIEKLRDIFGRMRHDAC